MNTNSIARTYDEAQHHGPPQPDDLTAWTGARVDYIHIHGYWPDIETGTVLEAKYDHRGWLTLLIKPDNPDRMTKWRSTHDILVVL